MSFDEENIFEISDEETVDIPATEETEDNSEISVETDAEKTNEAKVDEQGTEDEDKKVLEYLNKKGLIKYNGKNVEIESFDDLASNYQKGLNYDKVKSKNETEQNAVMSYISEMASKAGMTPTQYIDQVKAYQKQKEQEAIETDVQNMMSKGLDEETARRVARTEAALNDLEKEKAELQKQKDEAEKIAKEDKEYEDFLKEYPEIDASKIPGEVFKDAKEIGLINAYRKYENNLLREKIKQMELNQKNSSTSVVTSTTDSGSTEQRGKDDFERAIFYEEE